MTNKFKKRDKRQERRDRRERLKNRATKRKKSSIRINGIIKPIRPKCSCGKKIRHHHLFCDKCWEEKNNEKKTKM